MDTTTTVRFDLIWRREAGGDTVVGTVTHTFVPNPPPNANDAIRYETDLAVAAVPASPGDRIVLRFTTTGGDPGAYYIPNGDGTAVNGQTVNLTLP
jgi:hypothetical protein